jgi:universal stress protein A
MTTSEDRRSRIPGRVLVATDFSETADAAVRVAVAYAESLGASLDVLHVVSPLADPLAEPWLTRLAREIDGAVPVTTAVRSGVPSTQIVHYAHENRIDLIVLGTHGRTGISRALSGSVAERVVRLARCPVLTVPLSGPRDTAAPAAVDIEPRRCIVCGTPSDDLICESCRVRIRGEALEHKLKDERASR